MSYVQLALAKSHLAVYHSSDDALIQQCIDAAEAYAASYMNRQAIRDYQPTPWIVSNIGADSGSSETLDTVPAGVVQAVLMLTADYYNNREGMTTGTIVSDNPAVAHLLYQHRIGLGI